MAHLVRHKINYGSPAGMSKRCTWKTRCVWRTIIIKPHPNGASAINVYQHWWFHQISSNYLLRCIHYCNENWQLETKLVECCLHCTRVLRGTDLDTTVGNPIAAYRTERCVLVHLQRHMQMERAVFSNILSFILLNSVSVIFIITLSWCYNSNLMSGLMYNNCFKLYTNNLSDLCWIQGFVDETLCSAFPL